MSSLRGGHAVSVATRQPTESERAFLDAVLAHSFDGVEALRQQWTHATVHSSCNCGCGSLGFTFDDQTELEPSPAPSPLPVHVDVVDEDGEIVGGIVVLLRDGFLDDVDVYSVADDPITFPPPEALRWLT